MNYTLNNDKTRSPQTPKKTLENNDHHIFRTFCCGSVQQRCARVSSLSLCFYGSVITEEVNIQNFRLAQEGPVACAAKDTVACSTAGSAT